MSHWHALRRSPQSQPCECCNSPLRQLQSDAVKSTLVAGGSRKSPLLSFAAFGSVGTAELHCRVIMLARRSASKLCPALDIWIGSIYKLSRPKPPPSAVPNNAAASRAAKGSDTVGTPYAFTAAA
eukprot:6109343-Prymnesium_polylepis.2